MEMVGENSSKYLKKIIQLYSGLIVKKREKRLYSLSNGGVLLE